jgi:molybdopterin converting factor small subunit
LNAALWKAIDELHTKIIVMPTVKFTYALKRFFPGLKQTPATGSTLAAILDEMEASYPGVRSYVLDEQGNLRKHVNIFIDGTLIKDRTALSDPFSENSEIYIMQALSGG